MRLLEDRLGRRSQDRRARDLGIIGECSDGARLPTVR
jgi:hypothetical protein